MLPPAPPVSREVTSAVAETPFFMPPPASRAARNVASAAVETPWWYLPEQQAPSRPADQRSADSRVDTLVSGFQRRLSTIQKRCEATEAMYKEALAHLEEESAAMKLEIEELNTRIGMLLSPQGHGYGKIFRQPEDLDVQRSHTMHMLQYKPPQHQSLGRCSSCNSVLSCGQTSECSSGPPPPGSVSAAPAPRPAKEVHVAAAMNNIGTVVQGIVDPRLQAMFAHQLPGTGDSSNAKCPAEELTWPPEAVDAAIKDCELWQIESDLMTLETKTSARLCSEALGGTVTSVAHGKTPSVFVHSPPSGGVQTPRRQPRLPSTQQLTAWDLKVSQVMASQTDAASATRAACSPSSARHNFFNWPVVS